jgi:hypothetical protein
MKMFINKNGQQHGPFDEEKVFEMLREGQLSSNDFGIKDGQQSWQKLGEMFPQPKQPANIPPLNTPKAQINQQVTPTPQKTGSSKGLLFGLVGCGGLILLGIVGIVGFFALKQSPTRPTTEGNSTSSNSTSSQTSSPATVTEKNYKPLLDKAAELAKMSPPQNLQTSPIIKGKIAIVENNRNYGAKMLGIDYEGKKLQPLDIDRYSFSTNRLAETVDEIDTLIQLSCDKGGRLGSYEGGITAYANICKATIIDYKTPAIIAQKTFTNKTPPNSISSRSSDKEYVLLSPEEYDEFISGLPLEKLPNPLVEMPFDDRNGTYGKYTGFRNLAPELGRVIVPENLDSNAAIKGKMSVVLQDASGKAELKGIDGFGKELYKYDYEKWGVEPEKLAENINEIDTLIRVTCKKGSKLGAVGRTSVFANICEVSVIDYKAFKLIAKTSFQNKTMEKDFDKETYTSQYVVLYPYDEIDKFIKGLPKL